MRLRRKNSSLAPHRAPITEVGRAEEATGNPGVSRKTRIVQARGDLRKGVLGGVITGLRAAEQPTIMNIETHIFHWLCGPLSDPAEYRSKVQLPGLAVVCGR